MDGPDAADEDESTFDALDEKDEDTPQRAWQTFSEHDACGEGDRKHGPPQETSRDRRPSGEGHRKGHEARRAPRLGERDEIGEVREDERPELEDEHDHRPAEYERTPPPPRGEPGERDEHEGGERDRAAARDDSGREVEAAPGVDDEVVRVMLELDRLLGSAGVVRPRLGDDGLEPGEDEQHGHAVRGERRRAHTHVRACQQHAGEREADQWDREEERVRRVDEGKVHPRGAERQPERP